MLSLEEIKKLPPSEAINSLDKFLESNPLNEEALIIRGQKHWVLNQRSQAIKDYLEAIKINPDSKAQMLLDYAYSILNFYNKDLLNP